MMTRDRSVISALFGTSQQVGVSRALAEFHARRPVLIACGDDRIVALPAEGIDPARLAAFTALCAPARPNLVVTARRALSLGIQASAPIALPLATGSDADTILAMVADAKIDHAVSFESASRAAIAAIGLVKLAHALPAVLVADAAGMKTAALDASIVTVEADAVAKFRDDLIQSLAIAGDARVPINSGVRTRFVVFRDVIGANHVAVIVGDSDLTRPVPVRLHSACLTGDVFGSRRCDCGDQLRFAITRLAAKGGGIILYLPQEGRGLGVSNKMRAYRLQDAGLDTVDANTTLGFDDDERDYGIAARMLHMLGCTEVILLTNNPAKLGGLADGGIRIAGREPLETPINADNRRYLTAKAARSGHQLEQLIASLSDVPDAAHVAGALLDDGAIGPRIRPKVDLTPLLPHPAPGE